MGKLSLYYHTVKNMKPSQVYYRIRIKLGKGCSLGVTPSNNYKDVQIIKSPEQLDFDSVFIARFPVEELMGDKITLLHSSENTDWKTTWNFEEKTDLWNFNLHYFEYLFSLVKAWQDTGDICFLNKTTEIITGWIDGNPIKTKPAWASYTTALRIVSWISYYSYVSEAISEDFRQKFLQSLHQQYVYLSNHLEKDILGNHYFEDLKALVNASLFFKDDKVFDKALKDFKSECKEEILNDGMHFELSPMYHKIIFEGMLRVNIALRSVNKPDKELESYLKPMLDCAYSLEEGLDRIPLFNDSGNNVAKSLKALVDISNQEFELKPEFKNKFETSGFYIFKKENNNHTWKLIVDAGQPGPKYIPGHAHCDAMSYELFCDGHPTIVNCGTYAYQCDERNYFRSTAAHNTVKLNDEEQSQFWGYFRMAKRSRTAILSFNDREIKIELIDANKNRVVRTISFKDSKIEINNSSSGTKIEDYIHILSPTIIITGAEQTEERCLYAPEYGYKEEITYYKCTAKDKLNYTIEL